MVDPRSREFLLHEPLELDVAREAIAALEELGLSPNVYVDDQLFVARETEYSRAYSGFQRLPVTEVGDLLAWLDRAPTKLVAVAEPDVLAEARRRARASPRRVASSSRRPCRTSSSSATRPSPRARASRSSPPSWGSTSRTSSRSATARTTSSCSRWPASASRSRAPTHACLELADATCPGPEHDGVATVIDAFLDSARVIDLKRSARANADETRAALARKGAADAFDRLLEADERWRALVPRIDELRSRTKVKGKPTPEQLEVLQAVKAELREAEEALARAEEDRDALALRVPNPPHDDVPDGSTEDDVRRAPPRRRAAGARRRRATISRSGGSRWSAPRGCRARASATGWATPRGSRSRSTGSRSTGSRRRASPPSSRPCSSARDALIGTGAFPSDEANVYELPADDLYLAGTAEIPVASLHAREILAADELPLRYVAVLALLPARGGRGRPRHARHDPRAPVQQGRAVLAHASRTASWDELELLLANTEELVRALGAARTASSCCRRATCRARRPRRTTSRSGSRPRGATARRRSISNTTDFQARRLQIRFRGEHGPEPVHLLNGTAVVDRMALAILENFQGEVPDVLRAYGAPERVSD